MLKPKTVFCWVLTPTEKKILCLCHKSDFFFWFRQVFKFLTILYFLFHIIHLQNASFLFDGKIFIFFRIHCRRSLRLKQSASHICFRCEFQFLASGDIWCNWEIVTFAGKVLVFCQTSGCKIYDVIKFHLQFLFIAESIRSRSRIEFSLHLHKNIQRCASSYFIHKLLTAKFIYCWHF